MIWVSSKQIQLLLGHQIQRLLLVSVWDAKGLTKRQFDAVEWEPTTSGVIFCVRTVLTTVKSVLPLKFDISQHHLSKCKHDKILWSNKDIKSNIITSLRTNMILATWLVLMHTLLASLHLASAQSVNMNCNTRQKFASKLVWTHL